MFNLITNNIKVLVRHLIITENSRFSGENLKLYMTLLSGLEIYSTLTY